MAKPTNRQTAQLDFRLGKRVSFRAKLDVTPTGLLAISVLVSGILVATRYLVETAIREAKQ